MRVGDSEFSFLLDSSCSTQEWEWDIGLQGLRSCLRGSQVTGQSPPEEFSSLTDLGTLFLLPHSKPPALTPMFMDSPESHSIFIASPCSGPWRVREAWWPQGNWRGGVLQVGYGSLRQGCGRQPYGGGMSLELVSGGQVPLGGGAAQA